MLPTRLIPAMIRLPVLRFRPKNDLTKGNPILSLYSSSDSVSVRGIFVSLTGNKTFEERSGSSCNAEPEPTLEHNFKIQGLRSGVSAVESGIECRLQISGQSSTPSAPSDKLRALKLTLS